MYHSYHRPLFDSRNITQNNILVANHSRPKVIAHTPHAERGREDGGRYVSKHTKWMIYIHLVEQKRLFAVSAGCELLWIDSLNWNWKFTTMNMNMYSLQFITHILPTEQSIFEVFFYHSMAYARVPSHLWISILPFWNKHETHTLVSFACAFSFGFRADFWWSGWLDFADEFNYAFCRRQNMFVYKWAE